MRRRMRENEREGGRGIKGGRDVGRVKGREGRTEGERGSTEDAGMRFLRGTGNVLIWGW